MKTPEDNDKTRASGGFTQARDDKGADKPKTPPGTKAQSGVDATRIAARPTGAKPQSRPQQKTARTPTRSPDADRTRLARPQSASDKTRVAPQKVIDDKTRVALKRKAMLEAAARENDKTQFVKPGATSNVKPNIKPNIKPNVKPRPTSPDQTRFDPKRGAGRPQPSRRESDASADTGEFTVLKKRFVLEKVLGSGGMGVVYKAKDLLKIEAQDRDPYVAIKVLNDEFRSHPEAFIALQRESRKSQRIAHPNIVNVHDFDKDGGTVFMTMEFLDGKPLDQLIRQYKAIGLPEDEVHGVLKGLSSALIHAHAENVIHSDFKPGNIFVTHAGVAKVFDFGIARAVAKAEQHEEDSQEDKTVFDAGNLGALTPAYASLEMLEGEAPDPRDDLYALGCIAYELYTGEHPFNRIHANEAHRQKLKPKRINTIGKNEWQAIEKALAFKREDRLPSVAAFWELYDKKYTPVVKISIALILLVGLAIGGAVTFFDFSPDGFNRDDVRNELEYEIRLELLKDTITSLIAAGSFTAVWEADLWREILAVRELLDSKDEWLMSTEAQIFAMYLEQIEAALAEIHLEDAQGLIENARRYAADTEKLNAFETALAQALERQAQQEAQALREQEKTRQAHERKAAVTKAEAARRSQFDAAYKNVQDELACRGKLDMRDLEIAVKKLRSLNISRYRKVEANIIEPLSACIAQIGVAFPERAKEIKRKAMRLFESNKVIANTRIVPRDPCDSSLAGLGARGKRAICRDKIPNIGKGPALVVVPAKGSVSHFAISKYEISIDELNDFCKQSELCTEIKSRNSSLPATNISIAVANAYIKWLSKKTDKKYRLPTRVEWNYAAKAGSRKLDPNRNCELSTRGINKGGLLLKASVGAQNKWGLVNHIGNAREWVRDKGGKLAAVGGSYATPMESCNFDSRIEHDGRADMTIGFRILREI